MAIDAYSFAAPSRVKVLVVPVGRIKRSRFLECVERLRAVNDIKLGDVSPDSRGSRKTFSPLSFPNGHIIYDLTTSYDHDHEFLEGLELYRRVFMVIAIADFTEDNKPADLNTAIKKLYYQYPRALLHPLVMCNTPLSSPLYTEKRPQPEESEEASDDDYPQLTLPIPTKKEAKTTSIRTLMCDLTSILLSKFSGLARSLQALPSIESPMSITDVVWSQPSSDDWPPSKDDPRHSMPIIPGGSGITSGIVSVSGAAGARMSMTGFGSGSVTERARSKGKGRVSIAIGSLYLLAGRVLDAYREFVDGATIAKTNLDHLWHGKALEGIAVSIIIMAHLGLEFQIPSLLYPSIAPGIEKPVKTNATSGTASPVPNSLPSTTASLFGLMPDLLSTILTLYNRSGMVSGEQAPPLVIYETTLRVSKLLVVAYQCHGLTAGAIAHLVTGQPLPPDLGVPSLKTMSRTDIATTVMGAYPTSSETIGILDSTRILGAIASVLDVLEFKRRKALITRELVRGLIPGLIQARVVGAAEVGLHPAASGSLGAVSSLQSKSEEDDDDAEYVRTDNLLEDLCNAYGINLPLNSSHKALADWHDEIKTMISDMEDLKRFGWMSLKVGVLRSCVLFSEALSDYEGILRYTTKLLEIAGQDLTKAEQGKLAESFTRTVGGARRLGMEEGGQGLAEYWDNYLIQDIGLLESHMFHPPISHPKHELEGSTDTATADNTPFIYNPFSAKIAEASRFMLVQDEPAEFSVLLRNPYEFEIQLDSVKIEGRGVEFESTSVGAVIGPFRKHALVVSGTPRSSGKLNITGCKVKVYGCHEKSFGIIPNPLEHEEDIKVKVVGLSATKSRSTRVPPTPTTKNKKAEITYPHVTQLPLAVVPKQPLLVFESTSFSQSAIMVLEGEKQIFTVTLQNLSSTPADLVLFSFVDSTIAPLQAAIAQTGTHPAEIYELELILYQKQALTWKKSTKEPYIGPDDSTTFDVEILGKPGLTSGTIQVDYGHLGVPKSEVEDKFYTRHLSSLVTVTVNASIELVRMDFLTLGLDLTEESIDFDRESGKKISSQYEHVLSLLQSLSRLENPSQYCLIMIDLRNSWPHALKVTLSADNEFDEHADAMSDFEKHFTISNVIAAGHSSRLFLPFKRVYIENPQRTIPSFSANPRQFVVSIQKTSAMQERLSREAFWYRQEILKRLRGTWEEVGTGRHGVVELRNFRLTPRMVEVVRVDDIGIDIGIMAVGAKDYMGVKGPGIKNLGNFKYSVVTDTFITITTKITNRSSRPIHALLRLLPTLRYQPASIALDLGRKFAFNGTLQNSVGVIGPESTVTVDIGCIVLCAGEYEISGMVEEIYTDSSRKDHAFGVVAGAGAGERGSAMSAAENLDLSDFTDMKGSSKKSWFSKESCLLVAEDEEESI